MNIVIVILVGLVFGVIGLAVGMYRNKDKQGFRFLFDGVYKLAFYHLFKSFDKKIVEERLIEAREFLEDCYYSLDYARFQYPMSSDDKQYSDERLRINVLRVENARQEFDEALGLAYLNGFGKVADRVSRQLKTRKKDADGESVNATIYARVDAKWDKLPKFAQ